MNYNNFKSKDKPKQLRDFITSLVKVDFVKLIKNSDLEKMVKSWKIKPTQLRKFFDELRKIELELNDEKSDLDNRLILLIPMLKSARAKKLIGPGFDENFSFLIKKFFEVEKSEKKVAFKNLIKIMEAVVAYSAANK